MQDVARLSTFIGASGASAGTSRNINQTLRVIRDHLDMDVAFVSEFLGDQRVFRYVDSKAADAPLRVGTSLSMEEGYCRLVVDGKLPQLIPDTAAVPLAAAMDITRAFPIGAHLSVPIRLSDESIFGTLCCFSYKSDHTLNDRDLNMLRAFAELTAANIDFDLQILRDREDKVSRIQTAIDGQGISIVYQPIHKLNDNHIIGFECLARFSAQPHRPPDQWFTEAAEIGLAAELELAALKIAIRALDVLPHELFLTLNVSPEVIQVDGLGSLLEGIAVDRIIIELTEHAPVADYGRLSDAVGRLRRRGAKLAIDDAGAGYASLRHILSLRPDLIKLDISLIRGIDLDTDKQALASALIEFAKKTGADIIAEGVETASELAMLRSLQVGLAQGYLLNRPMALPEALQAVEAARTKGETLAPKLSHLPTGSDISTRRHEGFSKNAPFQQPDLEANIFLNLIASAHDVVIITRADDFAFPGPEIVYVNEAFCKLTGYSVEEVIGKSPRILQGPGTDAKALSRIRDALRLKKDCRVELLNYGKNGKPYWLDIHITPLVDNSGNVKFFGAIERDITAEKERRMALEKLAHEDILSGVGNRRWLDERFLTVTSQFNPGRTPHALIVIIIPSLKGTNQTYDSHVESTGVRRLAAKLLSQVRRDDFVARIDENTFAVILPRTSLAEARRISRNIVQESRPRSPVGAPSTNAGASVGIACFSDSETLDCVLQRASLSLSS